ncbi:hypothetical protein MCOR25_007750 [Pyricularia grisea]|nr:hypothetical protein MCOR25_007750 [Pyricularia grisea]
MSPVWFTPPGDNDDKATADAELNILHSNCDDALRLASQKAHEFEWNACVHLRMLIQATWLARSAVQYHVVNQVAIAPAFVPPVRVTCPDQILDAVIQKKIDLELSLTPWRDSQFKEDILSAVIAQPLAERTVSQTMHDGLLFQPIAVAIETKAFQGDENCGLVQLGVWTAAWHVGMREFMPPGHVLVSVEGFEALLWQEAQLNQATRRCINLIKANAGTIDPILQILHITLWHRLFHGTKLFDNPRSPVRKYNSGKFLRP